MALRGSVDDRRGGGGGLLVLRVGVGGEASPVVKQAQWCWWWRGP